MHRAPTTSESLFSSGNALLPASVIPMKPVLDLIGEWESILYYLLWVYVMHLSIGRYKVYPYILLYITIFFTLPAYPHAIHNANLFWILIPGF